MRRAFALATLAAAAAVPLTARAQASALRVATLPFDAGSEVFYGADTGFFARAGLDVQVDTQQSGPAVAAAIAAGALDVGFSNVVSIAAAHARGLPFVYIACGAIYTTRAPSSVLMVKDDSPIRSAQDLNGKTIGTNGLKNIGQFAPQLWIDEHGGDSSTVKFVEVAPAEDYAALDSGRLDACNVAEPQITQIKPIGRILGKPYDTLGEGWMIAGYFSSRSWADAHADTVRAFAAAMRQIAAWANANQSRSADILAKYTRLDPNLIRSGIRATFGATLTPQMVQPSIDLAARYKLIDASFPAAELIYQPRG